jgi:hypothetical protein
VSKESYKKLTLHIRAQVEFLVLQQLLTFAPLTKTFGDAELPLVKTEGFYRFSVGVELSAPSLFTLYLW